MIPTLTLAVGLLVPAAPVPKDASPAPAGPAPRIIELKPDADGKVRVSVLRPGNRAGVGVAVVNPGGPNVGPAPAIARFPAQQRVELAEVKDLTVITAGGKEVSKDDALKTLAAGGVVVIAADGKPLSAAYQKLFKDDVLVLLSPELAGLSSTANGGIKIQVQPGGVGGIQVQPLPAPIAPIK